MDQHQKQKILIVEQDPAMSALIGASLDVAGFAHKACPCDTTAFFELQTDRFDLILVDIGNGCQNELNMLDKLSAVETPLIFLVDRSSAAGQSRGLQYGADDFLLKPFDPADLLGRIELVLSRCSHTPRSLRFRDIEINLQAREVRQSGLSVQLTPKEFDLLVLLVEHTDVALSRTKILQSVWGYCITGDTRTVDMHIMQLRKKLNLKQKLKSVIKVGYRLDH